MLDSKALVATRAVIILGHCFCTHDLAELCDSRHVPVELSIAQTIVDQCDLDPVARGINEPDEPLWGLFLKDYASHPW